MGQMAYPNANRKGQPDAIFLSEGNQMDFFWLLCTIHIYGSNKLLHVRVGFHKEEQLAVV